ncbi:hypothetical protein [Dietzia maris]|uniref:hypothetical protein n=1 Tax=Dietzia maris TaxID=37915 RepID=UPI0037C68FF8
MPDLADDAATGVRGLPPTAAQWELLAVVPVLAVAATRTTGKTPFYAAIAIAGVNVGMLLIG